MLSDAPPRPRRILIAEDEAITSMMIEDVVHGLGCTVVGPAGRLREALRLAGEGELDGAVLDVNLNGESIYPVAEALAAREVPFVFLTGYGAAGLDAAHAHRRVLQKPFRATDLSRLLTAEFRLSPRT
jgi:CheY-like chemotaxis protein